MLRLTQKDKAELIGEWSGCQGLGDGERGMLVSYRDAGPVSSEANIQRVYSYEHCHVLEILDLKTLLHKNNWCNRYVE